MTSRGNPGNRAFRASLRDPATKTEIVVVPMTFRITYAVPEHREYLMNEIAHTSFSISGAGITRDGSSAKSYSARCLGVKTKKKKRR